MRNTQATNRSELCAAVAKSFRVAGASAIAVVLWGVTSAVPAAAQEYTLEGGAIGSEQVARGEEQYMENCAACHGEDLKSVSQGPDLVGATFRFNWVDKPLGEVYQTIHDTMPMGNPESLPDEVYADIVAYILAFNGVEVTEGELPASSEALNAMTVSQK